MATSKHPLDALETLSTGEDRDEWLAARVPVITATQAAAIVGSHPYSKMIDVWNEKTDPDYDPDALRNKWLEERAELGTEREPEIIAWATEDDRTGGPGAPFTPNSRLVANPDRPGYACTPDGAKRVGRKLVLIECKATQQRWDEKGVPQHVLDQCYWQLWVTGAVTVWLAVEFYKWSGRGANRIATRVGTMLKPIQQDDVRLAFILKEVEQFEEWLREGIAPESDVFLNVEPVIEFDDTPEDIAEKMEAAEVAKRVDALLTEEAQIVADIADKEKRRKAISAEVKKVAQQYEGRRVHLIGERRIAKFTRFNQKKVDTAALDAKTLAGITSWEEKDRLVIEANPEFVEPDGEENADENGA